MDVKPLDDRLVFEEGRLDLLYQGILFGVLIFGTEEAPHSIVNQSLERTFELLVGL
jgi:hypothetical protein